MALRKWASFVRLVRLRAQIVSLCLVMCPGTRLNGSSVACPGRTVARAVQQGQSVDRTRRLRPSWRSFLFRLASSLSIVEPSVSEERHPAVAIVRGGLELSLFRVCSFQTKLAGRGEEKLNSCSVQPRPRARLSQKLNQTTSPPTTHEASQMCRVLRQGVQQMSQSHQEVVTLHGLPVLRKAMLVLIALTLLHQKVAFDSPTMPCPQVASLMHVLPAQRFAGDPSMTRGFLHRLGRIRGQFFPGFFADPHMQNLPPPFSLSVAILDVIHPAETLLAITPVLLPMMVALQLSEPADLFPHRRQRVVLQHDHELPMVVPAQFYDRAVGIQPIQQNQDRQTRKILFHPLRQPAESF